MKQLLRECQSALMDYSNDLVDDGFSEEADKVYGLAMDLQVEIDRLTDLESQEGG